MEAEQKLKRMFLDNKIKIQIAEEAISKPKNKRPTALKYNISQSQVQNYVKNIEILKQTKAKKTMHKGKPAMECGVNIVEKVEKMNSDGINTGYIRINTGYIHLAAAIINTKGHFELDD